MKKSISAFLLSLGLLIPQLALAQSSEGDVVSTCIYLTHLNLTLGSRDITTAGEVSILQDFLMDKGLLIPPVGTPEGYYPTGYYGLKTVSSVKAYQASQGIIQTGTVGPLTRNAIAQDTGCTASEISSGTPANSNTNANTSTNPQTTNVDTTVLPTGSLNTEATLSNSSGVTVTATSITGASPLSIRFTIMLPGTTNSESYIMDYGDGSWMEPKTYGDCQQTTCLYTWDHIYSKVSEIRTATISNSASFRATLHHLTSTTGSCSLFDGSCARLPVVATSKAIIATTVPQVYLTATPTFGRSPLTVTFSNWAPSSSYGPYTVNFSGGNANNCSTGEGCVTVPPCVAGSNGLCTTPSQVTHTYVYKNLAGNTIDLKADVWQARLNGVDGTILGKESITVSSSTTSISMNAPKITTISPWKGTPGQSSVIYGEGFSQSGNTVEVWDNGTKVKEISGLTGYNCSTLTSVGCGQLYFLVPTLAAGTYDIFVRNTYGRSTSYSYPTYGSVITSTSSTSAPSITTTSLPSATVGVEYGALSTSIASTGGTGTRSWSVSGTLPPGIHLNPIICTQGINGEVCSQPASMPLVGVPTTAGTYTFTATVTVGSQTASKQLTIVVNPAVSTALAISLTTSTSTVVTGGTANLSWSVSPTTNVSCVAAGGNLANGLSISTSGSWTTPALYTTTQYGILCSNYSTGLSTTKYVTVNVQPLTSSTTGPTVTLTSDSSLPIAYGGTAHLSWSASPSTGVTCVAAGGNLAAGTTINTTGSWTTPQLYTNTQYGIQCTNSSGQSSYKYFTVTVATAATAPTVSFTDSTNGSTVSGNPYTLTLSSSGATTCLVTYTGPDGGGTLLNGQTSGSGTYTTSITGTYIATAKCTNTNTGMSTQKSITHTVTAATTTTATTTTATTNTAPSITLTTSASNIAAGGTATLSWTVSPTTNVTCVAAGGNLAAGTTINTTGSWTTPQLYTSTEYGIRCTNNANGLSTTKYVSVLVQNQSTAAATGAPAITLSANSTVPYGTAATISWSVSAANPVSTSCVTAGGELPNGTSVGLNGTWTSSPLYTSTQYGIQCTDYANGLSATKYTTVTVAVPTAPTASLSQSSPSTVAGSAYTISLSSTNATTCYVSYTGPDGGGTLSNGPTSGTLNLATSIPGTYTATASCSGSGGTVNSTPISHTVTQASQTTPSSTVNLTQSSPITAPGEAYSITLSSSGMTSCMVTYSGTDGSGGVLSNGPTSGSLSFATPVAGSFTATASCITSSGSTMQTSVTHVVTSSTSYTGGFSTLALGGTGTGAVLGATTACVDLPYNMYRGYESPSVTTLQNFLKSYGFLSDNTTGFYGDKTVAAVSAYQGARGLPQTGMVYDFTRAAIKSETCQ